MGTTASGDVETAKLTPVHWVALVLVLITGVIHAYVGLVDGKIPLVLAGVGFLAAAVVFLLNYRRRLLYLVGIVYTAVQIPLWYVANAGEFTTLGYVDKAVQAVLVVVLAYLYWKARRTSEHDASRAAV